MAQNWIVIGPQLLDDLDEARDYDAASSYNYLNGQLTRLRSVLLQGDYIAVNAKYSSLELKTVEEFDQWAKKRYPFASFS